MIRQWISWISIAIAGFAMLFIVLAMGILVTRPSEIPLPEILPRPTSLPKSAFLQTQEKYDAIGQPFLDLMFAPAAMQLPDLRRHLLYYGKNNRPDATQDRPLLHFGIVRQHAPSAVEAGQRLYLLYDASNTPGSYVFSPSNEETSLWIEPFPKGDQEVIVNVGMKGGDGSIIKSPKELAEFPLKAKEFMRMGGRQGWEIDGQRVDGTLLARQRARWYGKDVFLDKHGGEEFSDLKNRERIDFGDGEDRYSIYIGEGDAIIWDKGHWRKVVPGASSRNYPMMTIMKIDNRLMNLELWDVEGKGKVVLNLLKSTEAWAPQSIYSSFTFIGTRTRSQFVFEVDGERMLLSPQDWLLRTDDGWKKLNTPQEIDNYVNRKDVGVLFVLDGIKRVDGRQVLAGTLFNSSRTEMQPVELPIQKGGATFSKTDEEEEEQPVETEDDTFDEEDDWDEDEDY